MKQISSAVLQLLVFALVSASFTTIWLIQPVLPVLQTEFQISVDQAARTMSAVILGIALSTLLFGRLSDQFTAKPLILCGGLLVSGAGIACSFAPNIHILVILRFFQGFFIPSLTTCITTYLARNLPAERLNVIMGSYVSATVIGGLGGRILGGWIHRPEAWRHAFFSASMLVVAAAVAAVIFLPPEKKSVGATTLEPGFFLLLRNMTLLRLFTVGFGAMFVFSSMFNYLPFYLAEPPFFADTQTITLLYMTYLVGVIIAPLSGKFSNRFGNGMTMSLGAAIFTLALLVSHMQNLYVVAISLCLACAGFFPIHASAVGSINRKLSASRGRANALYILFYYLGGAIGITVAGHAFHFWGWTGVTSTCLVMLCLLFLAGLQEIRTTRT